MTMFRRRDLDEIEPVHPGDILRTHMVTRISEGSDWTCRAEEADAKQARFDKAQHKTWNLGLTASPVWSDRNC